MQTELVFSDAEKRFFANQRTNLNAMQLAINNAISLMVEQNSLEGQWSMNEQWTGLIRIDAIQATEATMPHVDSTSRERRANGKPL